MQPDLHADINNDKRMNVMRNYFKETDRISFSVWTSEDLELAKSLWGDPDVARYICAAGVFTDEEIENRLHLEISNYENYRIQYFPMFEKETNEFIGCCGLRPFEGQTDILEIGFHLKKKFWGKGMAKEAASAMIGYGFHDLHVKELRAGHNPNNVASRKLLAKLGFQYTGDLYYPPTGLNHPSYTMKQPSKAKDSDA